MAPPHPESPAIHTAAPKAQRLLALLALLLGGWLAGATQAAAPVRSSFDHLTTGFELLGQHRDLPCESCHVNAIFKGTPKYCAACHGVGTTVRATAKPSTHVMSTDQCDSCHTEVAWKPAVTFDHKQALGSCSSCHNGTQAQGKPPNHIVTDLECDACHTTVSWAGATFTHAGVTGNCASCHNGVSAQGMPNNHIPIGGTPCEACHSNTNFTNWLGAKINHPAVAAMQCASCHETANYLGMHPSTNTTAADSRPNATLDKNHPAQGDCGQCHDTNSFSGSASIKPANHIPTTAPCAQCHTTGNNTVYSVVGVHQGVTSCLSCHGPNAGPFANVTIVKAPVNHIPIGSLDCNGSGCHTTANVNPGGFKIGAGSGGNLTSPTLNVAGHQTVAAAVPACNTCHETAPYMGMMPGSVSAWGDSRPTTFDPKHPLPPADCGGCHTTSPTFASNQSSTAFPTGHIPIAPPVYATQPACATCHTTAGDFSHYSVSAVHQGVSGCIACHGSTVNATFLNVTPVTTPGNHIPIGTLDCNGSGCHAANGGAAGGFKLGAASPTAPVLNVAGHTTLAGGGVNGCSVCHESANYLGMVASTGTTWGDSRPIAYDPLHPAAPGECSSCHTTAPTFASNQSGGSLPANHIPIAPPVYAAQPACTTCHATPNNYALYSVAAVHQGVTTCNACHASNVNTTFKNVTMVTTPANHIPLGAVGVLDCNGSGCHAANGGVSGGFKIGAGGAGNPSNPTLNAAGHTTVAPVVPGCNTCHETAPYMGMMKSTASPGADSRPNSYLPTHPAAPQDCGNCHVTTPTFASNLLPSAPKPANHIPTTAVCAQCHTTAGNFAVYSVTGVHQGVTTCVQCHGPGTGPFAGPPPSNTITIVGWPGANHIPIGTADCGSSGCHTTTVLTSGGFKVGAGSAGNPASPTLNVAGHNTVSTAGVSGCQGCHETAPYMGMKASTAGAWADSRPTAFDKSHPTTGDCNGCHTTTPTFFTNQNGGAKPANHIPTGVPPYSGAGPACATCHTTAGNYAAYSVAAVHTGVTKCSTCHASNVANTFANVTIVTTPANHIPFGNADCNGSGCHAANGGAAGGFKIGAPNLSTPTLNVAGHTTVAGAGVSGCQGCHETAPYVGMIVSTTGAWGDSRPTAYDKSHPTTGDCNGCHTTTPTFFTNQNGGAKPANHIPTAVPPYSGTAPACATCHTTIGNYAAYSVGAVHTGVTQCAVCHGSSVANTFANVKIVTTPANHIPFGSADCNKSGCHVTNGGAAGGFKIGAASLANPTLNVAGHTSIASAGVTGCQGCHESAPYLGMIASTAAAWGDSRPSAYDKGHPTSGDCNGCHTTTPTFATNQSGSSAKPANHIPTNAPCAQCHTTAGNYAAYVMGATGHKGITNNCALCHAYGKSFYNMAPPTLKEPPPGATGHIPAVPPNGSAAIACELCHSPTQFTTFSGTVMRHAYVTSMKCMSCHEYGMRWKTNSGVQLWTRPDPGHHAGQDCNGGGCHSSRDKYVARGPASRQTTPATTATARTGGPARVPPGAAVAGTSAAVPRSGSVGRSDSPGSALGGIAGALFSHSNVAGTACATCHSGPASGGKPANHMATSNTCQSCHTTLAWLPVTRVDHAQVVGVCATCHNGAVASGKPSRHLPTTAACELCHTTNAWTPARFDHAGVMPHSCTSCHNAVRAIGLPRAHIPTTESCDTCHGTLAWSPVKVDHAHLTASCASCHNNIGAVGLSPGHLRTQIDCARCHSYPEWSAVHFRHVSTAYPSGRHSKLACTTCHTTSTDQVPYPSASEAGTCAGCHAKDFKPAAHPKTAKGVSYTAHELADCTGACHVYSDTTQSTITRSLPGPHHRATDATIKR
jgi:hypothetical protein